MGNKEIESIENYLKNKVNFIEKQITSYESSISFYKFIQYIDLILCFPYTYFCGLGISSITKSLFWVILMIWFSIYLFVILVKYHDTKEQEYKNMIVKEEEEIQFYTNYVSFICAYFRINNNLHLEIRENDAKYVFNKYKDLYLDKLQHYLDTNGTELILKDTTVLLKH